MYNKIYIIGNVGTGKTTLSKILSNKYNIKYYELDNIIYDINNNKRTNKEINILFNKILNKNKYIIEDVGRDIFKKGIIESDIVYYIDLNKIDIYYRCIKRWFKQIFNKEVYNYKPTIKSLIEMLKWAKKYNRKDKLDYIISNSKEYKILTKKDIEVLEYGTYNKKKKN